MPIEPKELTAGQEALLARAHAVTLEQIQIARQILAQEFSFPGNSSAAKDQAIIEVAAVLATNYLAAATKAD